MVTFANARHNPPLLGHRDGAFERLETGGMVLGVFADAPYAAGQVALRPDDRLVLCTDGITESRDRDGEEYGGRGCECGSRAPSSGSQ